MKHEDLIKPNTTFSFTITNQDAGSRLDQFMCGQFPLYSRNFFQQSITKNRVLINDETVKKSGVKLRCADVVTITFPPENNVDLSTDAIKKLGIELIHEHDDFLIIYKPAGVLVHRPNTYCTTISLVDWIMHYYQEVAAVGYVDRPGIVHRLDKDTSGLLIIPRTNNAHMRFGDMFKKREINKTYYALVQGHPDKQGTINLPIGRDQRIRTRMKAYDPNNYKKMPESRNALTHYKVIEYFNDCSLIEINLITGRTHQIRVHFKAIGHPLIGDQIYGVAHKKIDRQALHAYSLSFEFSGKHYNFLKQMPEDMQQLVDQLRHEKNF